MQLTPGRSLPRRSRPATSSLPGILAFLLLLAVAAGGAELAPSPFGAPAAPQPAPKATLALEADRDSYAPGDTVRLTARVAIEPGWHIQSNSPTFDYLIPTALALELPGGWSAPTGEQLAYPAAKQWRFAFEEQPIDVYEGTIAIEAALPVPPDAGGAVPITGRLRYQACDDSTCLPPADATASATLQISGAGGDGPGASGASGRSTGARRSGLLWILLLAFVGGVILNAMPCVLPVLSLKVFGLVESAGHGRTAVVRGALATAAGILVSFWLLAGTAVVAREAGAAIGWGIQFQNPGFVAFLLVVVVLFSLNLWGLFEVPLPSTLANWAGRHGGDGMAGHFGSGLFATLMATPCSAPFLGTALGFALAQPGPVILAVFTAVGLGMALPYLLLAAAPAAARVLPRPGAWMDTVRGLMGFLLAGAAVWLLYVLAAQVSAERVAAIELALLVLALCVWLAHRARPERRRLAVLLTLIAAAGVVVLAARSTAAERPASAAAAPGAAATPLAGGTTDGSGIAWQPFDLAAAERLGAAGTLVFVDVTADWCLTCKVNERLVLDTPEVVAAFARHGVIAMKADWTNRDDAIARYLAGFGRSGIPFYVLYRPDRPPHVFGEVLSRDGVIAALDESAVAAVLQR